MRKPLCVAILSTSFLIVLLVALAEAQPRYADITYMKISRQAQDEFFGRPCIITNINGNRIVVRPDGWSSRFSVVAFDVNRPHVFRIGDRVRIDQDGTRLILLVAKKAPPRKAAPRSNASEP